jgi:hypothetical protein
MLTVICVFMLGFAGCMKDEMLDIKSHAVNVDRINDPTVGKSYEVVNIRHTGFTPADKSYAVSMLSDGTVIFEGQANTLVLGQKTLKVDEATMNNVLTFFDQNHFYDFPEKVIVKDIAMVSVSVRPKFTDKAFTVLSNDDQNNMLFTFTRQVENMLGVSVWIYGGDKREPVENLKM